MGQNGRFGGADLIHMLHVNDHCFKAFGVTFCQQFLFDNI